jgi:predicted ferric reductase
MTVLLTFVLSPVGVYLLWGRTGDDAATVVSVSTGLIGIMLLLAAFVVSRIRVITNHLGVEAVLKGHRIIAISGLLAIATHITVAVLHTPGGAKILIPWTAIARVRWAEIATVLLLLIIGLALTRIRRKPRYEGWRLWHLLLAWGIITAATIHTWLVGRIIHRPVIRWELLGVVVVAALFMLYRWLYRPLHAYRHSYLIEEVRREASHTVTVALRAHKHTGAQFAPGQFAFLKVGHSPFVFAEHPFTVSSGATDRNVKEITIKALGDFTEVVESLRPGRQVYLDGPFGRFTTDGVRAPRFIFIAGGIGITPMMSMIRTMNERHSKKPVLLIVTASTKAEFIFTDELDDLTTTMNLTVVKVVMKPPKNWTGEQGRITKKILANHLHVRQSVRILGAYYICGPPLMVASVVKMLEDLGVPTRHIHTELFGGI